MKRKLAAGKEMIRKLEKEIRDPKNREKLKAKLAQWKVKVARLKTEFKKKQRRSEAYVRENPGKAVALAAAAGALAGALLLSLRRRK